MPSFTLNGTPNGLVISVVLSNPFITNLNPVRVNAILDTGAARTMISDNIAEALKLRMVDVVPINSVKATNFHPVYLAKVQVPITNTLSYDLKPFGVIGGLYPGAGDCVIGMDILRYGLLIYNGQANSFTLSF